MNGLRVVLAALCVSVATPALASHSFGGIDVCTTYRGTAPPGLEPAQLPTPDAQGAAVLNRYCTQCHALPGPGRHTAAEWPAVLERMNTLMEVASRFRGLMGKIQAPPPEELVLLREYLQENALQPLTQPTAGYGAPAFAAACAGCHTLPDPRQHDPTQWSAVVRRMQHHMAVMDKAPPATETMTQVLTFLERAARDSAPIAAPGNAAVTGAKIAEAKTGLATVQSWLALGPFFALALLGLVRWGRRR